ncbi:MAG: GWxTD domain-containing protein [Clostridiales bacterium]|nr:GWxTD domain-containing protein [Clostridiales bacterium]
MTCSEQNLIGNEKGRKSSRFIFLAFILILYSSCASSYKIIKLPLDQNSQKFLDFIRYIVTPQEEKIFREMPPEDRHEFITDFWKRRDPIPETEENEFRSQYYARLAVADKAFRAGIPGWMTDRGRIYILLGPPTDVIKKSMGEATREFSRDRRELSSDLLQDGTITERPTEIWVYNHYPDYFAGPLRLVFVDYESNGDYKLTTDVEVKPFSMMTYIQSDPNLLKYQWIGEIVKDESLPQILPFLDYSKSIGKLEKSREGNTSLPCFFDIPFRSITYGETDNQLTYDLELSVEVRNVEFKGTYTEKKEIREGLSLERLASSIKEGSSLTESLTVPLEKGTNTIYFSLFDKTQQKRLRKLEIIKIK